MSDRARRLAGSRAGARPGRPDGGEETDGSSGRERGEGPVRRSVSENSIVDRWARLVVGVVDARADPVNLERWSRHAHMSVGTLRQLCSVAGVRPKASLDLARVLRAVVWLQDEHWMPEAVLDCRDPRTLRSLLSRTGCPSGPGRRERPLTPQAFLASQSVVPRGGPHLRALLRALATKITAEITVDPTP